jgi:formylglycine-generating enzyme required for sulfatase activity
MKFVLVEEEAPKKTKQELRLVRVPAGGGCDEFWYGETLVTVEQWEEVMGSTGLETEIKRKDFPITSVTLEEIKEFCQQISPSPKVKVRLPTEREQCWGLGREPERLEDYAVFGQDGVRPVKTKLPNEWGLYDVRGLVWEWCETNKEGAHLRGGAWYVDLDVARAVCRSLNLPSNSYYDSGFRIVASGMDGKGHE